jgi:hypothetical protein
LAASSIFARVLMLPLLVRMHPLVRCDLLSATVAYMTVSPDYPTFIKTLDAHRPRFHDQLELPFEYRPDEDDGKGL